MSLENPYNCYICSGCKTYIITKDLEHGVTPFMIECRRCDGDMRSSFYNVPEWVSDDRVEAVWKKDFPPEYTKHEREISQQHQDMGGLFLHYLSPKEPDIATIPDAGFLGLKRFRKVAKNLAKSG